MWRQRFDSLFSRLIAAQAVLMLMVGLILAIWLVVARVRAMSEPYSWLWAPTLLKASTLGPSDGYISTPDGYTVRHYSAAPSGTSINLGFTPGLSLWLTKLNQRGLPVTEIRLSHQQGELTLWFVVAGAHGSPVWLTIQAPPFSPVINRYNLGALMLVALLIIGASWRFARRVTQPLLNLQFSMQTRPRQRATTDPSSSSAQLTDATSEIRAIDSTFRQLIDQIHQADRERNLLLAGVSHDLRSPLARIRLAAEMLPATPELAPDVEIILRNVDQADRLIGSFTDFVRVNKLGMNETVQVSQVVETAVGHFPDAAGWLTLEISADARELVLIRSNSLLIERLVFNLIDNAVKHGHPPVVVSLSQSGREWQLTVRDHGKGMPDDDQARLMQAFVRGDNSRNTPGTGLGLSVVQLAVARLGGTLQFSQEGSGHVARVVAPRSAGSKAST